MEKVLAIGEIGSAVLIGLSIALLLEWLGLRGLMCLMPTAPKQARLAAPTGNETSGLTRGQAGQVRRQA